MASKPIKQLKRGDIRSVVDSHSGFFLMVGQKKVLEQDLGLRPSSQPLIVGPEHELVFMQSNIPMTYRSSEIFYKLHVI